MYTLAAIKEKRQKVADRIAKNNARIAALAMDTASSLTVQLFEYDSSVAELTLDMSEPPIKCSLMELRCAILKSLPCDYLESMLDLSKRGEIVHVKLSIE